MGRIHRVVLGAAMAAAVGVTACGASNSTASTQAPAAAGGGVTAAGDPSTSTSSSPSSQPSTSPSTVPTSPVTGTPPGSGGPSSSAPAPDECAGLVPTPGTPVEISFSVSDIPFCHLPTSNGNGTAVTFGVGLHHMSFDVYPMAGGASLGSIRLDHQDTGPVYDAIAPSVLGFHAAIDTGVESVADRGTFSAYDDRAALLTTSTRGEDSAGLDGDVRLLKPDPAGGGSALLTLSGPLETPTYHVEIVDAGGHRTAGAVLDRGPTDLAVAIDGHVLLISADAPGATTWRARWLDHDAQPLTEWFVFQVTTQVPTYGATTYLVLEPLADGSIALREGDAWTIVFPNGAAGTQPAPAWLASRKGMDVAIVRGGKAMAVAGAGSIAACGSGDSFEVTTPSGRSCGTVHLTSAAPCAHVTFGRDGTAFTLSIAVAPAVGNQLCTYRWWPGLVR